MSKQTVVLDFDGTMHLYSSGWQGIGIVADGPVPGTREAVAKLRQKYIVVVVSSRCAQPGGMQAIKDWLKKHSITVDDVSQYKPPHALVVDDRGFRFNGNWDEVLALTDEDLKPWNKR